MDLRLECDWSDPLRHPRRHAPRRPPGVDRSHPAQRARRPLLRRAGPDLGQAPRHRRVRPARRPRPGALLQSRLRQGPPLDYHKLDPKNPEHVARWKHWATWKLGFMDAAWKESQFGVSQVRPDYLSLTQSQYGWSAFTDGYYFNVVRSLPITSGHGGYHDFGPGFFNPSLLPGDGPRPRSLEAVLVSAHLVRQHDQRPVPPRAVPVVPDRHPGHDVAARPGAGDQRRRAGRASSSPTSS